MKQLLIPVLMGLGAVTHANNYLVQTTGDNGGINPAAGAATGTLRQAIVDANAHAGADVIDFNIPGGGVQTITLAGPLPAITDEVAINGYTQPGATMGTISGRTITLEIITPGSVSTAFFVHASNTSISGIAFTALSDVSNAGSTSIRHDETPASAVSNVKIWGNYFNTNAAGTVTTGTGYAISVYGNTSGAGAVSNLQGWIIGTDGDGIADNMEGNLFSHPDPAIQAGAAINEPIRFFNCDNFVIAGNTIGLKKDGITPLQTFNGSAGQNYGIALTNCTGMRIGTDGNGTSDALERNVIAGMRSSAIVIFANINGGTYYNDNNNIYTNRPVGNNSIAGNYLGTDTTGIAAGFDLQNRVGIQLTGTSYNKIGDSTSIAKRNVIVNNRSLGYGIYISGARFSSGNAAPSRNNLIANNYIGVLADGSTASSNITGVRLNANNSMLAGDTSVYKTVLYKNIIANSTARGVDMRPSSSPGVLIFDNTLSQNAIYTNTGLGINLGSSTSDVAVSANDGALSTPSVTNANRLMDYGVIKTASLSGNNLTINGFVGIDAAGTTNFGSGAVVEFFIADNSPADQNGARFAGDGVNLAHGEGRVYLGSMTADANGLFSGTLDVSGKGFVAGTSYITNTATEYAATGSTSEFGLNVTPISIAGHVFDDANGMNNNIVDGLGTNAGGLNAVLYDSTTRQVIAVVPVAADGTFSFTGAVSSSNYTVYITTASPTVGQTAAPVVTMPSGWTSTGEHNGAGSGSDGSPNGTLPLGVLSAGVSQANFGIEQPPTANDVSASFATPAGTATVQVPTLNGDDPEDGVYPGTGNADTVIINTLPASGTLYYNGTPVVAGQQINGYNPALLTFDPNGDGTYTFTYSEVDAAGKSSSPATVTMIFTQPLPVMLKEFTAAAAGSKARLDWTTTMEQNNVGFHIQRSADGSSWTTIGFAASKADNGNSSTALTYSHYDASPLQGINYYRLEQEDRDGRRTLSEVRQVRFEVGNSISIYPNPAIERVYLKVQDWSKVKEVRMLDARGRVVYRSLQATDGIDMQGLAQGTYLIQVEQTDSSVANFKAVKQK